MCAVESKRSRNKSLNLNSLSASFLLGLQGPDDVHEVLSFYLGPAVGAQRLLGGAQGALGVLEAARLEELDDPLLVAGHARDLGDDLPDQLGALPDACLAGDGAGALGLDARGPVALIPANRNVGGMAFGHWLIIYDYENTNINNNLYL